MSPIPIKQTFLERAVEIQKFHATKLRENPKWTAAKTAQALGRSSGSVSEDLLIASWMKTHLAQLEKFDYRVEALEYIRGKELEMKLSILE